MSFQRSPRDDDDELELELERAFSAGATAEPVPPPSADDALGIDVVADCVLQYLPPSAAIRCSRISKTFWAASQLAARRAALKLLRSPVPSASRAEERPPHPVAAPRGDAASGDRAAGAAAASGGSPRAGAGAGAGPSQPLLPREVACAVEAALYAQAGGRAVPHTYGAALKRLAFNLRSNAELRGEVIAGAIAPARLVTLSALELQTRAAAEYTARVRAQAAEAARRLPPRADISQRFHCRGCGGREQFLRRFLRLGATDATKAHELLVCTTCRGEVFRSDTIDGTEAAAFGGGDDGSTSAAFPRRGDADSERKAEQVASSKREDGAASKRPRLADVP